MDFLDRLIDYIESNISLDSVLRVGKLSLDSKSISIRPTPSSMVDRYVDKDKIREYSFQILMKDPNQFKVINKLDEITNLLDGIDHREIISNNNSFKLIKCEVYTLPNYVEETEHEEYIYTAMFRAELQGGI